jgi:hypothetical protein
VHGPGMRTNPARIRRLRAGLEPLTKPARVPQIGTKDVSSPRFIEGVLCESAVRGIHLTGVLYGA